MGIFLGFLFGVWGMVQTRGYSGVEGLHRLGIFRWEA